METFSNKHAPPAEDKTTSPSEITSSKPIVFSESYIASAFVERYIHQIVRLDDYDEGPDDDPIFLVPNDCKRTPCAVEIIRHGGFVGTAFLITKIRELVAELTADADEFTQIRCGAFSFAKGVLEYLKTDPRLASKPARPRPRGYDFERISSVMEARRHGREKAIAARQDANSR